ncbi:MAG TPA: AraC family transcriptional regulator [Polyangiaceae bacterium]|nr:AraC family transcriptional regulator [Polyangiaceae bacterium]
MENSRTDFRYYTPDYEFLTSDTWRGDIALPQGSARLEPGVLVCLRPGDVCSGQVADPGSRTSLHIERELLEELLAECGLSLDAACLRRSTRMSAHLEARLRAVHAAIAPDCTVLEIRAALVEFVAALASEAVEEEPPPSSAPSSAKDAADAVRRCLEHDPSTNVDLAAVARETGMSRFRALRVFKRWYGLPPHTYQLHVRVCLVQKSLRSGSRPAEAAAEYGFVDQSHLTRHFRRLLGITPAVYARIGS